MIELLVQQFTTHRNSPALVQIFNDAEEKKVLLIALEQAAQSKIIQFSKI